MEDEATQSGHAATRRAAAGRLEWLVPPRRQLAEKCIAARNPAMYGSPHNSTSSQGDLR